MNYLRTYILFFFLFLVSSLFCNNADASLGGSESSVRADRLTLRAQKQRVIKKEEYSIHEMTLPGRVIREYVLSNGTVFGITWRGISQPDLSVLLGSYFDEYEKEYSKTKLKKGSPLLLRSQNLVVQKSGHMRDVRGKAYIPSLLPQGFSAAEALR